MYISVQSHMGCHVKIAVALQNKNIFEERHLERIREIQNRKKTIDPKTAVSDLEKYLKNNYRMIMPKYTFDAELNHLFNLHNKIYQHEYKSERLIQRAMLS
jgi:hypothetical protein